MIVLLENKQQAINLIDSGVIRCDIIHEQIEEIPPGWYPLALDVGVTNKLAVLRNEVKAPSDVALKALDLNVETYEPWPPEETADTTYQEALAASS